MENQTVIIEDEKSNPPKKYTIEQFSKSVAMWGGSFSHDEKKVQFNTNLSGIYNVHELDIESGEITQLSHSKDKAIYSRGYFGKENHLLFEGDVGGNELFHIYAQFNDADKTIKDLTPFDKARCVFMGRAFDRKSFFYGSNQRNPYYTDLYEMDFETLTPKLLFQNEEGEYNDFLVSCNKRYIAMTKMRTREDHDQYLWDTQTQKMIQLSPEERDEDIAYHTVAFSNDDTYYYYLSNQGSEFHYLERLHIENGTREKVVTEPWGIDYAEPSHSFKYLSYNINWDGKTVNKILDFDTKTAIKITPPDNGNIVSVHFSKSDKWMVYYTSSSRHPRNMYLYNFETQESKLILEGLNSAIDANDLVEATVVRYPSFDGLEIPAIFYKPKVASPDNKVPAMLWIHGGPGGQSRQFYNPMIQCLVNQGYAILAVNNRGSSGYGKTFFKLDERKHGNHDLDDCVYGKNFLNDCGFIDMTRVGIMGGSYGGYMTLAALTFRPDAFKLGVDIFGVANWVRTLSQTPPWWKAYSKALHARMGHPEKDLEYLRSISPLFHTNKITKPLMVLQGANDPRVLKVESDEIVEGVKANGIPVEYVLFEDEGHGWTKKENEIEANSRILAFLDTYLK